MIIDLYDVPLPNNGEDYKFTRKELEDLLQKTFNKGISYARSFILAGDTVTYTTYNDPLTSSIKFFQED